MKTLEKAQKFTMRFKRTPIITLKIALTITKYSKIAENKICCNCIKLCNGFFHEIQKVCVKRQKSLNSH